MCSTASGACFCVPMDLAPSSEDLALTRLLIQATDDLQIQLLDHLIIGANAYRSLRQDGAVSF